jgi:hypothetical protein
MLSWYKNCLSGELQQFRRPKEEQEEVWTKKPKTMGKKRNIWSRRKMSNSLSGNVLCNELNVANFTIVLSTTQGIFLFPKNSFLVCFALAPPPPL